jgi:hypothetical protein
LLSFATQRGVGGGAVRGWGSLFRKKKQIKALKSPLNVPLKVSVNSVGGIEGEILAKMSSKREGRKRETMVEIEENKEEGKMVESSW